MKKIKVLLTSAGGLTGTYLLRNFKDSTKYEIFTVSVDINQDVPAKYFSDVFYKAPKINDEKYINFLKKLMQEYTFDCIIPITSLDVDFFSVNKFSDYRILTPNYIINETLSNKRKLYNFFKELNIEVPKVYDSVPDKFPVFIKPEKGSGSKNSQIIKSIKDYYFFTEDNTKVIVTEYLNGEEYTVDCLFDLNGKCIGYNNRKRLKTISGGAVVTVSETDENLDRIIKKLENLNQIIGPVNFQYIKNNGKYYIIDFNTRLASGGLPLSVQCGFNIPEKIIDLILTGNTEIYRQSPKTDGTKMIRYYNEIFIKESK